MTLATRLCHCLDPLLKLLAERLLRESKQENFTLPTQFNLPGSRLKVWWVCFQIARLERATSSGVYKQDLFSTCGLIYVCESTSPPCRHLMDLIELCNGQVPQSLLFLTRSRSEKVSLFLVFKTRPSLWLPELSWGNSLEKCP